MLVLLEADRAAFEGAVLALSVVAVAQALEARVTESGIRCAHTWKSGRQCELMASWSLAERSRHSGREMSRPVCDDSKNYLTRAFRRRGVALSAYFRQYFDGIDRLTFTPLAGGTPEVVED